jgi:hypothetical protein
VVINSRRTGKALMATPTPPATTAAPMSAERA